MASPYSGNKDAVQSPSPALAPGATPTVSLVQDADGNTTANLYQAWKVPADAMAYLLASSRPDFAVLNASGSGFTTPVNTALGGTITPSGNAHIADGVRFTIQIQTGGVVGVATFKTSMDGGSTYGALQTTAASMTDATSGITLAFVGTFTGAGTSVFRSAFTPLAQWLDQGGNARGMIDHNGYRRGRVTEFYEDWLFINGALSPGTGNFGRFGYSTPTGGNGNYFPPNSTNNVSGLLGLSTSGTLSGNTIYAKTTQNIFVLQSQTSLIVEFECLFPNSADNMNWMVGFSNVLSGTPSSVNQIFAVGKRSSDTNYQLFSSSGSVLAAVDSGVVPASSSSPLDRITLELHGSASPYGARARLFVNEKMVETTTVPTATAMPLLVIGTTVGTSSSGVSISPLRATWNRVLSIPAV